MSASPFHAALIRAGAYGVHATRSQHVRGAAEALAFVQSHIDATVLPRVLSFRAERVPVLDCSVSGRRLIALETEEGRLDVASADQKTPALSMLRSVITKACAMPLVLDVQARPLRPPPPPGQAGISAQEIARVMEVRSELAAVADRLAAFVDQAGGAIHAAARIQDDMLYPMKGPDDAQDRLGDAVDSLLQDLDALHEVATPSQQTPALMMFGYSPTEPGFCAVFDGPQILFAETRIGAEAHLAQVWGDLSG